MKASGAWNASTMIPSSFSPFILGLCGHQIVVGHVTSPVAERYQPSFKALIEAGNGPGGPFLQVNDG